MIEPKRRQGRVVDADADDSDLHRRALVGRDVGREGGVARINAARHVAEGYPAPDAKVVLFGRLHRGHRFVGAARRWEASGPDHGPKRAVEDPTVEAGDREREARIDATAGQDPKQGLTDQLVHRCDLGQARQSGKTVPMFTPVV